MMPRKIHAIEIGNEANIRPTWPFVNNLGACGSTGDVVRVYKGMLQSVHSAVKSIAP